MADTDTAIRGRDRLATLWGDISWVSYTGARSNLAANRSLSAARSDFSMHHVFLLSRHG